MNGNSKKIIQFLIAITLVVSACQEKKLPFIGYPEVTTREVDGKLVTDSIYLPIPPFQFTDQDHQIVNNETFKGKIYVTDFFFTSCRTICPIMKTQMLRVYEQVEKDPDVLILSHTIDPEYDTVELLHDFAKRLDVKSSKWHFVTGQPKEYVYELAQKSYFVSAMEDKTDPGGFIHSGAFLLIDKQGRIRGKYDGTKEDDVNRLIADINVLKREQ